MIDKGDCMATGWVKCEKCGTEYFIKHLKSPMKDIGEYLSCSKCGEVLHKWGKGTDCYLLFTKEEMIEAKKREELKPKCECGAKMIKRKSEWGYFLGCSRFPECQNKKKLRDE